MWKFNKLLMQFFLICALLKTCFAVQLNTVLGCSYNSDLVSLTPGFQASFYYYPCKPGPSSARGYCQDIAANEATLVQEFHASGYLSSFVTATGGVTDPQFTYGGADITYDTQKSGWYHDIYDIPITGNNYTLQLTGYFLGTLIYFKIIYFLNVTY